ncbi:MAG: hypothetical protein IPM92_04220 [Saprospiraceae bacterium]|nr:hypothetical protein [Saprospiraceae bacterium]
MFELHQYISSGVIESYCLGNLPEDEARELLDLASRYPEIQMEIDETLAALKNYRQDLSASKDLKSRTLHFLEPFLAKETIDLKNPPFITRHSDAFAWKEALVELQPEYREDDFAIHSLKATADVEMNLVWLYGELVEDQHPEEDFTESFLIIEGACECDFEGQIVRFSAGDYFDVPIGVKHVIKNITKNSGFVKGIVQRRKAA